MNARWQQNSVNDVQGSAKEVPRKGQGSAKEVPRKRQEVPRKGQGSATGEPCVQVETLPRFKARMGRGQHTTYIHTYERITQLLD